MNTTGLFRVLSDHELHQEVTLLERKVAALRFATSAAGMELLATFSRRLIQARAEVQRRDSLREASEEKTITEGDSK